MNYNNWSLHNAIKKQVNLEATHDWALKKETLPLPKFKIPQVNLNPGLYNFIRNIFREIRP